MLGCSGRHPPWKCGRFGNIRPTEREKIIEDNKLCAFCLLHNRARPCVAREKQHNAACNAQGLKSRHIRKLHEFLKDIYEKEGQVHLVQEDDGWEELESAWEVDETEEEEGMIVNTIQQVESSWQEVGNSWLELEEEEENEIYCVRTCHGRGRSWGPDGGPPTQRSCNSMRERKSTSSISSWAVKQQTKMRLERHRGQQPQVQQAKRAGREK